MEISTTFAVKEMVTENCTIYLGICKLQQQWHYLLILSQSSPKLHGIKLQLLPQDGSKASICLTQLGQDSKSTKIFQ